MDEGIAEPIVGMIHGQLQHGLDAFGVACECLLAFGAGDVAPSVLRCRKDRFDGKSNGAGRHRPQKLAACDLLDSHLLPQFPLFDGSSLKRSGLGLWRVEDQRLQIAMPIVLRRRHGVFGHGAPGQPGHEIEAGVRPGRYAG